MKHLARPFFSFPPLISERIAPRHLGRVRLVKSLAEFTTVDFRLRADKSFHFLRIIVPALQMAAAELAFLVFFVAGTLLGFGRLDLGRSLLRRRNGCCFVCHSGSLSFPRLTALDSVSAKHGTQGPARAAPAV